MTETYARWPQTIYKVMLTAEDDSVELPSGARLLHVEHVTSDRALACMWFQVVPGAEPQVRRYRLVPTGMPWVEQGMEYAGTAVDTSRSQSLVMHVYEVLGG